MSVVPQVRQGKRPLYMQLERRRRKVPLVGPAVLGPEGQVPTQVCDVQKKRGFGIRNLHSGHGPPERFEQLDSPGAASVLVVKPLRGMNARVLTKEAACAQELLAPFFCDVF
jgi:hypothetical protein